MSFKLWFLFVLYVLYDGVTEIIIKYLFYVNYLLFRIRTSLQLWMEIIKYQPTIPGTMISGFEGNRVIYFCLSKGPAKFNSNSYFLNLDFLNLVAAFCIEAKQTFRKTNTLY